jgi:hypothetical protein
VAKSKLIHILTLSLLLTHQLFHIAAAMRCVELKAKDVTWPFILLIVVNLIILLAWMIADLLQWSWVEIANYNSFGRSVESFGFCFVFNHDKSHGVRYSFMITLGVLNFVAIPLVNYEGYHTAHLLSDFNKSFYLTLSMASIMESFLVVSTENRWTSLVCLLA